MCSVSCSGMCGVDNYEIFQVDHIELYVLHNDVEYIRVLTSIDCVDSINIVSITVEYI